MSRRNFDNFITGFMDYCHYAEAPECFIKWTAISIIAGALERRVWLDFKSLFSIYPNMYIMLVGPSGSRKTTSANLGIRLIKRVEGLAFTSNQMTEAAFIDQVHASGANRFFSYDNVEFNNSSVFSYSPEALVLLDDYSGDIIKVLTDMYDCYPGDWSVVDAWKKQTVSRGEIKIFNPCVNLLACSTPEWLVRGIGIDAIKGGFASRTLFVVHEGESGIIPSSIQDKTPKLENTRRLLVEDLTEIANLKGEFSLHGSFAEVYDPFFRETKKFMEANPTHKLVSYFERKHVHMIKLAQVLTCARTGTLELTGEVALESLQWLGTIEPQMFKAFGGAGEAAHSKLLFDIWEYMRAKTIVTRRELATVFHTVANMDQLNTVLLMLKEMGRIEVCQSSPVKYKILNEQPLLGISSEGIQGRLALCSKPEPAQNPH